MIWSFPSCSPDIRSTFCPGSKSTLKVADFPGRRENCSWEIENGCWHFMKKFTGRAEPQVISRFLEMWEKGTFFSQEYLKCNFFSENTRVGWMNSPSTIVVYRVLVFLSFPMVEFRKKISLIFPLLLLFALN